MPGRNFNSNSYRYGWNEGSEKDDEITGITGAHINTFFREYDTRLGRTWSIDPKAKEMPWQSPYSSMDNNPIWYNDPMGDKPKDVIKSIKGWVNRNIRHRTSDGRFKLNERKEETHWILETKTETILDETRYLPGATISADKNINLSSQKNVSDYQIIYRGVYSWANENLSMSKNDNPDRPFWVSDRVNRTSPILPNIKKNYTAHVSHTYPRPSAPTIMNMGNSTTVVSIDVVPAVKVTFQVRKLVTAHPGWFEAIRERTAKGTEKNYTIDD